MSEEKKQYEISYLARTETDKDAVLGVLREAAVDNLQEGRLTEIKLSYPVKKQTSAFFGGIIFEAFPESITKINNSLKFSEGILRFLIIAPPAKKSHPYFGGKDKAIKEASPANEVELKEAKAFEGEEAFKPKEREKLDDAALDERLEEILTNAQIK